MRRPPIVLTLLAALAAAAPAAPAAAPPAAVAVAVGTEHACALLAGGTVECWGAGGDGQLGAGPAGEGTARCNGAPCAPVAQPVAGLAGASAIAAGGAQTCALLAAGTVACWGDDADGQLGAPASARCGADPCSPRPLAVAGIAGATALAVGAAHACALLAGGTVECWGADGAGQLGDGGAASAAGRCGGDPCRPSPVRARGIANAVAIAAGGASTCALLASGAVDCWGADDEGQLGDGHAGDGPRRCAAVACAPVPEPVSGLPGVARAIALGERHACALLASGAVDCWGLNVAAELGIGTSSAVRRCAGGQWCSPAPVAVLGVAGVRALAAGADHTCALTATGAAACWGFNSFGQLGDGTAEGPQTCYWQLIRCAKTPVPVAGLLAPSAIAAGGDETCAIAGGAVRCWGADWFGELGDGSRGAEARRCGFYPCAAAPVAVVLAGTSR